MKAVYFFIFSMWLLILAGGWIVVTVLGPLELTGFGEYNSLFSSIVKAVVALILVVLWIFLLSRLKNWIFRKELHG